jgi:Phage capsid protein
MVSTISQAFVEQFKSNVYQLSQQRGSRLGDKVRVEALTGNVDNFERIGAVTAQAKASRHADTPVLDAPSSRRKVSPVDYDWGDLIDREDKLRLIISPESEYAIAGANALGRAKDDLIIAAFIGNATDGAGAAVTFPAGNIVAVGAVGLTEAKVLSGIELLNRAEVDDNDRYFAYGSQQLTNVLQLAAFTSADYNTVRTLMAGKVETFMGLSWVRSERLAITGAGGTRRCIMWQKMAMGLAVNSDMFARIAERADKSFAWQVYCSMTMGATRIEEAGVIEVDCDEV